MRKNGKVELSKSVKMGFWSHKLSWDIDLLAADAYTTTGSEKVLFKFT